LTYLQAKAKHMAAETIEGPNWLSRGCFDGAFTGVADLFLAENPLLPLVHKYLRIGYLRCRCRHKDVNWGAPQLVPDARRKSPADSGSDDRMLPGAHHATLLLQPNFRLKSVSLMT
jgi:hypothetical protein